MDNNVLLRVTDPSDGRELSIMFPIEAATVHANECYPNEASGFWIADVLSGAVTFKPCGTGTADGFRISPGEWLEAERLGEIRGVFHSHIDAPPLPSGADVVAMEAWGLPWVIMSVPSMEWAEYLPQDKASARPLLGRQFQHGGDDCYGIVRDYFKRLGVALPDFVREPEWWERGASLYLENYEKAGFSIASDAPRANDVLLMQIHSPVPNHGAVYLGDGLILHHIDGRLSCIAVYGDFWRKATTHVLRYGGNV